MKCNEFKECVCEIVDNRLSKERMNELLEHAHRCPHCEFEYQSMLSTKKLIQSRIKHEHVPADVYYAVMNSTVLRSKGSWFTQLFGFRWNPALVIVLFAVISVGVYSLFIPSATGISDDANILTQSLKNYQAVIGGTIKPQLVSSEDNVRSFLMKEVAFDVNVPKMKGCNSCAGVLSSFKGVKLAHVVYQVDNKNIIYIYQASLNDAMNGSAIGLPEEAKEALKKTSWYVREQADNTTIVVWQYNNTLCSAVSAMNKDEMIALLTEKEKQP